MIGTREICALLLGTSLGIGSTVAVQQAKPKPSVARHLKQEPVSLARAERPAKKSTVRSHVGARILDCPAHGLPFSAEPIPFTLLPPLTQADSGAPGFSPLLPGVGGGGIAPSLPPTPSPGVPEPAGWALMLGGFGLIGLACRRRRVDA